MAGEDAWEEMGSNYQYEFPFWGDKKVLKVTVMMAAYLNTFQMWSAVYCFKAVTILHQGGGPVPDTFPVREYVQDKFSG